MAVPSPHDASPVLRPWHEAGVAAAATAPGDTPSARLQLAHALGDDAALAAQRLTALGLADGTDLSRRDDHQVIDLLAAAVSEGRLRSAGSRPPLMRLVLALAAAPAAAVAPGARRAVQAAAAPAADTTFGSDLDVAAMVAALTQAARDGVPLCEECARAAAQVAA